MSALNRLLVGTTDVLLAPVSYLPPLAGVVLISLVTALALLLVIRKTSNQRALGAVKRSIQAGFFELRLFGDDVPAILRTELEMLRHSLTYLRLSFVPVLWLAVPLTLVLIHLDFHFGYTGLAPGSPALVTATLAGAPSPDAPAGPGGGPGRAGDAAVLEAPSAIRVETRAVWFPASREAVWRITPSAPGAYVVGVRVGREVFTKTVQVSEAVVRRSPVRLGGGVLNQLLNPSESPLPDGSVLRAITVPYPRRDIRLLAWDLDWLVVYFLLSFAFMLALKRALGVIL